MKTIRSCRGIRKCVKDIRHRQKSIGFVPTMGYLHEGHLRLVRAARRENDAVIVSVFVNPAQFAPHEDFAKYPRNLKGDKRLLLKEGCDIVFAPSTKEIYEKEHLTTVEVGGLSQKLCGRSRKRHFQGVATIVAKLFNLVSPDKAYFGRKDLQQSIIIGRLIEDLNFDLRLRVLPIVRSREGMALSSRNAYLNAGEKNRALAIVQSLRQAKHMIRSGRKNTAVIKNMIRRKLKKAGMRVDYVEAGTLKSLDSVRVMGKNTYIAIAAFSGKTRLIDNMVIDRAGRILI